MEIRTDLEKDAELRRQYVFIEKCRKYVSGMEKELGRRLSCHVHTFGCQMNARDSEKLLGILLSMGFMETDSEEADFVLYNTCTVRDNAEQRVYGRLGRLHALKKENPGMIIALCGCMMQEPSAVEKIKKSYPFVDLIFGTHNIYKLAELMDMYFQGRGRIIDIQDSARDAVEALPAKRKFSFKSGVNIMFGCNNFCSYCIVPYVRGRERSRAAEDILAEIQRLVADGVVEVMLLGQNVNSYGKSPNGQGPDFPQLLRKVNEIEGLRRIRFMTSHPRDLSEELIFAMRDCEKVCRHLHLPLQSGSSRVLKAMNRHYTKDRYLELARKLRETIPGLSLTTDIIVGFPGETEEDFEETLDVVRRVRFENAFTFIYSKRRGTPAAAMVNQVPEPVVKDRFSRLLEEVQKISREACKKDEGKTARVLVESANSHEPGLLTGRLENNLTVHFPGDESLIGQIVPVRLSEARGFYYMGSMAGCPSGLSDGSDMPAAVNVRSAAKKR